MTAPLLMTGPGGDYVTRFDVKGASLVKTRTNASASHDQDAHSSGSGVAWGFLGRRSKNKKSPQQGPRRADHFEHTSAPVLPATYAKPALADLHQQLAMLQAIENWLETQQQSLNGLAQAQVAQAELASASGSASGSPSTQKRPQPTAQSSHDPVRVIRFNSTTMALPTPAPSLTTQWAPEPCHVFAANDDIVENLDNPTPTPIQRSVNHDQPQPHPEATENFDINSRHPAIARLFADDERARRSARRLQSHRLRARRSPDQKGLPGQGCEQSTLFGAVA